MLLTIVSFLVVFTIVALVHEWGHLYFSKKVGIRVHEFGLGFGPTLFSVKKNNTTYKINLLPILGYVRIAGLEDETNEEKQTPETERYTSKSPWAKFLSIAAGAVMNLVLGFLVFSFVFMMIGMPSGVSNTIDTIAPGSEAAKIGLQPGDKLLTVNKRSFEKPEDAVKVIHDNAGKKVLISVERNGQTRLFTAVPQYNKRLKMGLIGFSLKPTYEKVGFFKSFYYGATQTLGLMLMILVLVGKLFVGKIAIGDLAGPVGIAQITGQYAQQGILSLLNFIAFFSINVGLLNLLPIPALDGGRLVFVLIEAIRRKPIKIEVENKIHQVGLIVLLTFLAALTVNDVLRFFK